MSGIGIGAGLAIAGAAGSVVVPPLTLSLDLNNDTQDESVDFGDFPALALDLDDTFSVGIWVKYTDTGYNTFLSKGANGGQGWKLAQLGGLDAGKWYIQFFDGGAYSTSRAGGGTNDGNWHLLIATYNASGVITGVKLSTDGSAPSGGTTSGGATPSTILSNDPLTMGALAGIATGEHIGQACYSFVYNTELSAAHVTAIWNLGTPISLFDVGPTANLVHWSTLGDGCAIGAGNMVDLAAGNNGTFINGEAGDFVLDVPP